MLMNTSLQVVFFPCIVGGVWEGKDLGYRSLETWSYRALEVKRKYG